MAIVRNGAGLLTLTLLLAGCTVHVEAGTGSPGARPKTSTVPNVPSAIVVSKSGAPGDFTVTQMQAALLDQDDLAPGWTVGTSTINTPDPPATGCPPLDELNHWPATKVIIGFIAGDGSSQLVEGISSMSADSAKALIRTSRSVVDQCMTISIRDTTGQTHVQDLTAPDFPQLGDETHTTMMGSADTFYFTTAMIRRGGTVLIVGSMSRTPEAPLLEPFARQALAKIDSQLR